MILTPTLAVVLEALAALSLLMGAFFLLVGALGIVRFNDFFMRLHAPTKASTLGIGGVLLGSMLMHASRGEWRIHEVLITFFVFLTAPVSANLMAKAAFHLRVPSKAGHQPVDEVESPSSK